MNETTTTNPDNTMTNSTDIINDAASLIADYNPSLAAMFINQPFKRVDIACAFSRGFVKSPGDDMPKVASIVIRIAMLDKEIRMANNY